MQPGTGSAGRRGPSRRAVASVCCFSRTRERDSVFLWPFSVHGNVLLLGRYANHDAHMWLLKTYAYMYIHMHTHTLTGPPHTYRHTHAHTNTHANMHIHRLTCTCTHTLTGPHACTHMQTRMRAHVHSQARTCKHTHKHTCTCMHTLADPHACTLAPIVTQRRSESRLQR